MIKRVNENPLIYRDGDDEFRAMKTICPKHGNEVWYIKHGDKLIFVKGSWVEIECQSWRDALRDKEQVNGN